MSATVSSIPASRFVQVIPGVLNAGGNALDLSGMFLSSNTRVPIGQVLSFASAASVLAFFGPSTPEYAAAQVYFAGFTGCTAYPGAMLITQYPMTAVAAYLRGGPVGTLTLAQLQAMTGTLTLTVNGTATTSATINLSSATSFSAAAALIQAGFTSPAFAVTYDSVSGALVFTTSTTGATAAMSFASGTLAAGLLLTAATGALTSQGAAALPAPASYMTALTQLTQNWATFSYLFNPDGTTGLNTQKLAFATWNNTQKNRWLYVPWDNDITATEQNTTSSLGYLLTANEYSGTAPVYETGTQYIAAFLMGFVASLNFGQTNGRFTAAYRGQAGLVPEVTGDQVYQNLLSYDYNCYAAVATANQNFTFLQPGSVSGPFLWIDSYVNQIWLNNALQLALIELMVNVGNIPYNQAGFSLVESACLDPIDAAVTYGAIRSGVTLSQAQIAELANAAGKDISSPLQAQGWYLSVVAPSAQVQAARGSPQITLWYTDGESVQTISMNSVEVE